MVYCQYLVWSVGSSNVSEVNACPHLDRKMIILFSPKS